MHDNTISQISDSGLDNVVAVAVQVAFVGTVFMLAISGTATIVFRLSAAM